MVFNNYSLPYPCRLRRARLHSLLTSRRSRPRSRTPSATLKPRTLSWSPTQRSTRSSSRPRCDPLWLRPRSSVRSWRERAERCLRNSERSPRTCTIPLWPPPPPTPSRWRTRSRRTKRIPIVLQRSRDKDRRSAKLRLLCEIGRDKKYTDNNHLTWLCLFIVIVVGVRDRDPRYLHWCLF